MQILINGLASGAAIALLAVAFQVVYLPTRVFFIAVAGTYTLAPFIAWALLDLGAPLWIGLVGGVVACVAFNVLAEWANHGPLSRKNASASVQLIASLGLYIIVVQSVAIFWGNETKTLQHGFDTGSRFANAILTSDQRATLTTALILLTAFLILLRHSGLGLRLRALADNPRMFALYGYSINFHRLLAFGLGGVFAAAASLTTAYDIGFDPHTGLHATLLAIVAVIIGGRGSFIGPIIGGLILGLLRAQVVLHLSARWQEAATFALLVLFLLLRPQGIFGRQTRIEAD